MTLEYIKEDIETLKESVHNLIDDSDYFFQEFRKIWYFIIATAVFTAIGIISVLSWTTT